MSQFKRKGYAFKKVDTLYVFGDSHGKFENVKRILQNSGIVDENLSWTGGNAHLVFVGDILKICSHNDHMGISHA